MDEATKKKILDVLLEETASAKLPSPDPSAGIRRVNVASVRDADPALQIMVSQLYAQIEAQWDRESEPSPKELENLLERLRGKFRYKLRDVTLMVGKKMPHRPGGAPKKLKPADSARMLRLLGQCIESGDTYPEAVGKMAKRFQVSTKTIHRESRAQRQQVKKKREQ